MAPPLLATKFHIPSPLPHLIPRTRLMARMNEGFARPLTLISAPAGFGKTTLLSAWAAQRAHRVTWLSLDEGDNDRTRFWSYFIAALQKLHPELGANALAVLHTHRPLPIESFLTILVNDITAFPDSFAVVLDDYHIIHTQAIHDALAFLLDHMPSQMHLIITGRADPPMPLRGAGVCAVN